MRLHAYIISDQKCWKGSALFCTTEKAGQNNCKIPISVCQISLLYEVSSLILRYSTLFLLEADYIFILPGKS